MFTEINLQINEALPTSTGGTVTGAKIKLLATSQGLSGNTFEIGGCVHESQEAEEDANCEAIKIIGLNPKENRSGPATSSGKSPVIYFEYFGIRIAVTDFADLDTEAKRIALVKDKLVTLLGITIENITTI
jgi:hypothetical protein